LLFAGPKLQVDPNAGVNGSYIRDWQLFVSFPPVGRAVRACDAVIRGAGGRAGLRARRTGVQTMRLFQGAGF